MAFDGSVSFWIAGVKAGCETAATQLWGRYRKRLLWLARLKLNGETKTVADEEDVAVTAFHSFLRRCRNGSYPDVRGRDDLWRLLMIITIRKANNQIRTRLRLKRRQSLPEGVKQTADDSLLNGWDELVTVQSRPDADGLVAESLEHLLAILGDDELRSIVLYKLEGCSNEEIASRIDRSLPTIERRLRLIREKWRQELEC